MIFMAAVVVGLAVGCGSDYEAEKDPMMESTTASDILRLFHERAGLDLRREVELGKSGEIVKLGVRSVQTDSTGDLVVTEDAELVERFGDFSIIVYDNAELARAFGDSADDCVENVAWRHHPPERDGEREMWSARTLYGNIELVWFTPRRATDARWRELDGILSAVAGRC